jgi:hypothetical protein
MAIDPSALSSQTVFNNYDVVIEMVTSRPRTDREINPIGTPGKIIGFYNVQIDAVELFIINAFGNRYIKLI